MFLLNYFTLDAAPSERRASNKDYDLARMLTESSVGVEGEAIFDRLVQLVYEESYDTLHQFLFESKNIMSPEKLVDAVAVAHSI